MSAYASRLPEAVRRRAEALGASGRAWLERLDPLVEALQKKGVRVSVVSTIRSSPPMIADDLRRQADNFIELEELKDVIGRPPRPAPAIVREESVNEEEEVD